MAETLRALEDHYQRAGQPFKAVIWAHNSHLGNARATEMGDAGELNLGQLVREHYGKNSFLIGFSTYSGTVTAASGWDRVAERKRVRRALPDSYEHLFHDVGKPVGMPDFMLLLNEENIAVDLLRSKNYNVRLVSSPYRNQSA